MPGVFSKWWAVQRLPSSKIPDGIFLQAGLAVLAFRAPPQTKTSLRLSNPAATPSSWCCYCPQQQKKYPHLPGVFSKWWAVQRLPSSKIPDGIFLQAGLAVLAFRAPPQTKTSLRLSNPAATPSSWCCYCPQQQKKYPHLPGVFSKWWAVQDLNL